MNRDDGHTQLHYQLLGHHNLGVTELRIFKPLPKVAYTDNIEAFARLVSEYNGKADGIYAGVQPRPIHLFDNAPNRWVTAHGGNNSNCATAADIEYITTCFWDIDVVSTQKKAGHPASNQELKQSLCAAQLTAGHKYLNKYSTVCCSGNGHYVLTPVLPIEVADHEISQQFRLFCEGIACKTADKVKGVKFDAVYDLSRVMRVMGTINRKGTPLPERVHREAVFTTPPVLQRSVELHHIIENMPVQQLKPATGPLNDGIICNLEKLRQCEFIKWCQCSPKLVTEPLWFGLITNLCRLKGGVELIHEISKLDTQRYDFQQTRRVIERAIDNGYRPVKCRTLISYTTFDSQRHFICSKIDNCYADAPMYFGTL